MTPEIGDIIKKAGSDAGRYGSDTFRVSGWLKALPPMEKPAEDADFLDHLIYDIYLERQASGDGRHGPDKERLVWCVREEAEYVVGSGVCGIIWRVADCEIIGNVTDAHADGRPGWSAEQLEQYRQSNARRINERLI